ncbi:Guanylate-binding protein 6 [Myotis davidii]|uniref:Guanylate-binding protein 6 n=1 Tax=Myotis davidii TaxID=225400 RepID=L5LGN0_MYODS|nr:Guanylate-binding protein 6 [Myotis davidii]
MEASLGIQVDEPMAISPLRDRLQVDGSLKNYEHILDNISQPVVVVAIAGLYRTGKSYLMNLLAGQNHGFCLCSTVPSETKGIWMWCVPHPSKPNHTLVFLVIEGLGDVEKGDSKNDSWIFALAVLLSSMFVYNSMSTINHQALKQLHSGEGGDSAEFASFFPDFVWVVQDFMLELELDGRTITEDEYLENALKLVPGLGTLAKAYVDAINSGAVPCLENAVKTLAELENSAVMQKAADHYSEQMADRVSFPTDTLQELLDLHSASEREAIAVFMENSFKDNNQGIIEKKEYFLLQNEDASGKYCRAQLNQLSESLMESISRGMFSVPNGVKLYLEGIDKLEHSYTMVPRKGVKPASFYMSRVNAFFCPYLEFDYQCSREPEVPIMGNIVQRIKAESEATTRKILEEVQKKNEQKWKEREKNYKEHMKRLEKMEKVRAEVAWNAKHKLQVFNSVITILTSTVQNQKHCLKGRALCHFSNPNTSRHYILLLLQPVTISGYLRIILAG